MGWEGGACTGTSIATAEGRPRQNINSCNVCVLGTAGLYIFLNASWGLCVKKCLELRGKHFTQLPCLLQRLDEMDAYLLGLQSVEFLQKQFNEPRFTSDVSPACHSTFELALSHILEDNAEKGESGNHIHSIQSDDAMLLPILFVLYDEKAAAGLPSSMQGQIPHRVMCRLQLVAEQPGLIVLQSTIIRHDIVFRIMVWICGKWWSLLPQHLSPDIQPARHPCRTKHTAAKQLQAQSIQCEHPCIPCVAALDGGDPQSQSGSRQSSAPAAAAASGGASSAAAQSAHSGRCTPPGHDSQSDSSDDESVQELPDAPPPVQGSPPPPDTLRFEEYRLSPQCIICLEAFPSAQPHVRAAFDACNHAYCHVACASSWTAHSNSCPLCKAPVQLLQDVTVAPTPKLSSLGALAAASPRACDGDEMDATVHRSCMALNRSHAVSAAALQVDAGDELTAALQAQLENSLCQVCGHDQDDHLLLLCDGCEAGAHTYCVGLPAVPAGDWFCSSCQTARTPAHASTAATTAQGADPGSRSDFRHPERAIGAAGQPSPAQRRQHPAAVAAHDAPLGSHFSVRDRLHHIMMQRRRQHRRLEGGRGAPVAAVPQRALRHVAPGFSDSSFSDSELSDQGQPEGRQPDRTGASSLGSSAAPPSASLFAWADRVQLERPARASSTSSGTAAQRQRGTKRARAQHIPLRVNSQAVFHIPKKQG